MSQKKILIVDDEANIRDLLTTSLQFAGYNTTTAESGTGAVSAVLADEPDLIIMDVMLPDMNGLATTRRLREAGFYCPVLFLSARDSTEDKIEGLTAGGDDYVTKPFSLDEIVARVAAILRRTTTDDIDDTIRVGDLVINQSSNEVLFKGHLIDFSPTEFKLLHYFMLNPNRVLSKSQILNHVWDYDFDGDSSIVESYISYIRRKFAAYSTETVIHTKRGFGYIMKTR